MHNCVRFSQIRSRMCLFYYKPHFLSIIFSRYTESHGPSTTEFRCLGELVTLYKVMVSCYQSGGDSNNVETDICVVWLHYKSRKGL